MWIPNEPRRDDFCGRPPCGLCFHWKGGDGPSMSGFAKMALDLLQKRWQELSTCEKDQLRVIAAKIHKSGISALATRTPEQTPPPEVVDIGMDSKRQTEGWLKSLQRREMPERQLTLDEIAEREESRQQAICEKEKARKEMLEQARAVAEVFKEAPATSGVDPWERLRYVNEPTIQKRPVQKRPVLEESYVNIYNIPATFIDCCYQLDRNMPQAEIIRRYEEYKKTNIISPITVFGLNGEVSYRY